MARIGGQLGRLLDGVEVEWKTLGDVIISLKTGLNPRQNFQLNTGDAEGYYVTVREIQNGNIVFFDRTDRVNTRALNLINNRSNLEVGDILFSGTGTVGRTAVIEKKPEKWNIKEGVYVIKPIHKVVNVRYLSYLLNSQEIVNEYTKKIVGSPVISLPMGELKKLKIPIPCPDKPDRSLAIQAEIVRILDTFTELTRELTRELTLRKKQYEYYRDRLLTFEEGEVEWKTLGEEFPFIRNGFVGTVTPFFTDAENGVRYLQGTNIHNGVISDNAAYYITKDFHKKCSRTELKADDILMVQSGHVGESAVVGEKYKGSNCHALIVMSNGGKCNSKFVNYYFQSTDGKNKLKRITTGGTVKHILASKMKQFKIPIPSLAEQARIVAILDKFDTLTTSISEGLPREIALRQQQYEYYRDLLLSFPKADEEL